MTWLYFVAASLACFRLTRLITNDKIMDWLRRDVSKAGEKAEEGITCPFCVSFYWSAFLAHAMWGIGINPYGEVWLWALAIWGASILLNQLFCALTKKT